MTREIKNYIAYFIKSNRRILILESVILFIVLPFFTFNQTKVFTSYYLFGDNELKALLSSIAIITYLFTFALAFFTPLYIFRYTFKRKSCDLYYALPIKKGKLFDIHCILGALFALIPLCVNVILSLLIFEFRAQWNIWPLIQFLGVNIIIFLISYFMNIFILTKCHNFMDAFIVQGAYYVIPLLLYLAVSVFLQNQVWNIFVSENFSITEFVDLPMLLSMISLPVASVYGYGMTIFDGALNASTTMYSTGLWLSLLWIVIGGTCYYFARRSYVSSKEEHAEEKTTALGTYPLIIVSILICFALIMFSSNMDLQSFLMMIVVIFILYIIMLFFANRKIHLSGKDLLIFVIIFACTFGFSMAFQNTKGFGLLYEAPNLENISKVEVHVYSDHEDWQDLNYTYKKESDIKKMVDFQKDYIKENSSSYDSNGVIEFNYTLKDGKTLHRYYYDESNTRYITEDLTQYLSNNKK